MMKSRVNTQRCLSLLALATLLLASPLARAQNVLLTSGGDSEVIGNGDGNGNGNGHGHGDGDLPEPPAIDGGAGNNTATDDDPYQITVMLGDCLPGPPTPICAAGSYLNCDAGANITNYTPVSSLPAPYGASADCQVYGDMYVAAEQGHPTYKCPLYPYAIPVRVCDSCACARVPMIAHCSRERSPVVRCEAPSITCTPGERLTPSSFLCSVGGAGAADVSLSLVNGAGQSDALCPSSGVLRLRAVTSADPRTGCTGSATVHAKGR